jgi:prepilin-type processing-associated H-X9-DG protein
MQCVNNLKNTGLGLQNFHSARGEFPYGGFTDQPPIGKATALSWGSGWPAFLLPYVEQGPLFDQLLFGETADGRVANDGSGWTNPHNYRMAGRTPMSLYLCPSSSLRERITTGNSVWEGPIPEFRLGITPNHYVGISGYASADTPEQQIAAVGFYSDRQLGRTQWGAVSSAGLLFTGGAATLSQATDGASNTMIVSEMNDLFFTDQGAELRIGSGLAYGWLLGSAQNQPPSVDVERSQQGGDWRAGQATTIRYPINDKRGWQRCRAQWQDLMECDSSRTGVGTIGANVPLNSAHPGGVNAAFADGSVHFLVDATSLATLARLAVRDDGQTVELP